VLRALLYCHGLVLEDPLAIAAELVSGTVAERRAVARSAVRAAAASIAEIAPLIDAGVVQTYFLPDDARNRSSLDCVALARSAMSLRKLRCGMRSRRRSSTASGHSSVSCGADTRRRP
jgi:hypothetical protein